jgi:hypothetical protein
VASGTPSQIPFAIYDPTSSCWKTSLSSAGADSTGSRPTWPNAGTTRNGYAYEHPRWEPPTEGPGCSSSPTGPETAPADSLKLLPTPQARDGDGRGASDPAARRARGHSVGLDDAVSILPQNPANVLLFPTPRASDGTKGSPNQRGSKGDLMLTSAIARLAQHPDVPAEAKRKKTA